MRARFQAVVTQVVFEHSLRIRLKAGTADRKTDETTTSLDTASDVQLENQAGADLSSTATDDQQIAEALPTSTKATTTKTVPSLHRVDLPATGDLVLLHVRVPTESARDEDHPLHVEKKKTTPRTTS